MERTQRVAKLEALLARVQSRSSRGETHGNAAVAMPQPAAAASPVARVAPAPIATPVAQAAVHAPPKFAESPKPSPVAASAPPPNAEAARLAAHDQQEEAATVVRDVPVEALAAIAAATAAATAQGQSNLMPPAAQPVAERAPPAAAAQAPAASLAPAFRGTSAFGGLSKKMTLIGTAPPANWPPRGAETSVPPPDPAAAAAATTAAAEEASQETHEAAPEIQATESEGDLDALLGDEASLPPTEEQPAAAAPVAAAHGVASSTAIAESKKAELPIVSPAAPLAKKKSRSGLTVFVMIALWLIALGVIWFVYRSSM
jgi:hypothetical protein